MKRPSWLPAPLNYDLDYNGNWDGFLADSYATFNRDVLCGGIRYRGKKVIPCGNYPDLGDGRHGLYWHVVSTGDGKNENTKVPDIKRMEVVGWIKPVLESCPQDELLEWEVIRTNAKRRSDLRTVIWCKKYGFMVILKELNYVYVLITASTTEYPGTIERLELEYRTFLDGFDKAK